MRIKRTSQKINGSAPALPSLSNFWFLLLSIALLFIKPGTLLIDGDTGYHIRLGEYILKNRSLPDHDIFSPLAPSSPWIMYCWLSEVVMAAVHRYFGLNGIVLSFAFLIAFIYSKLFEWIRTHCNTLFAFGITALCVMSSLTHFLARPYVFSVGIVMIWYGILDLYQYQDKNRLYLLPLLMLIWINSSSGFIYGFILIIVYLLGNLWMSLTAKEAKDKKMKRQKTLLLGIILLSCLLISLINPSGYKTLFYPFEIVLDKTTMDTNVELLSPNFHYWVPFEYYLFLIILLLALSRTPLNPIEITLLISFLHMSLYAARNIEFFAIIAAPIAAKQAQVFFERWPETHPLKMLNHRITAADKIADGRLWIVILVLVTALLTQNGRLHYDFKTAPKAAMEFVKKNHISGNMFNDDGFGDYIIYSNWPDYKVLFYGLNIFGAPLKDLIAVAYIKPNWKEVLNQYQINWILWQKDMPLSVMLKETAGWKLIYEDEKASIFVKNTPENQALIRNFTS